MRFSIQRELFLKPLTHVCSVVERRQTLPILSNLLLQVEQNTLFLLATDLEVEISARIVTEQPDTGGKITLPARKLLDICRALPEQAAIEFALQKDRMTLRSGQSRFTLATTAASEFPNTDAVVTGQCFTLPQRDLRKAIEATQFAMAHQDVRYYLNGLMLEQFEAGLNLVATDGHRLAYCGVTTPMEAGEGRQVIIPRKGVSELLHILEMTDEPVELWLGTNHIKAVVPGISITAKLIDGKFPDYQRVIPIGGDRVITLDRQIFRQALTRVSVVSNEKHRSVRIEVQPDHIKLYTHNLEQEEAEEELPVQYGGEEMEIGFNVTYLLEALSVMEEDTVQLILTDANSSCLLQPQGKTNPKYVVMPMRL